MRLRAWLRREGMSVRQFAEKIGEPDSIVRKWVYGQRQPSLRKAVAISELTSGEVRANDLLLEEVAPKAEQARCAA
ncbi:helix-turn-helix domain-containing protein [Sphingomonas sp. ac-8]|uniref:helix-turn-helix domain-containing protein n=1 Tax=Sphingomonas sp. ac-8 TaxID=3242977 RepID=UPI003A7FB3AC